MITPHFTTKWIGGNPSLVLLFDVPASGLDSSLNPLAPCGRDSLAVEDDQRHLRYWHGLAGNDCLPIFAHNAPVAPPKPTKAVEAQNGK